MTNIFQNLKKIFSVIVGSSTGSAGAGITINTDAPIIAAASPTSQSEGGIISGSTLINQGMRPLNYIRYKRCIGLILSIL